jgi:hypothetical protein
MGIQEYQTQVSSRMYMYVYLSIKSHVYACLYKVVCIMSYVYV